MHNIHWPLSFFISQMIAALVINRAKNPPNGRLCKCSLTLALKFEAMVVSSTNKHASKRTGVSSKLESALLNPGKVASGVSYRVHGMHVNFVQKSAQPVRGTLALGGAQRTEQYVSVLIQPQQLSDLNADARQPCSNQMSEIDIAVCHHAALKYPFRGISCGHMRIDPARNFEVDNRTICSLRMCSSKCAYVLGDEALQSTRKHECTNGGENTRP
jgi:hypothetical protein